jgi:magnesium-transporting ATPase (P-type)
MLEAAFSLSGYLIVLWLAGWHLGLPLENSNRLYVTATTMTLAGIVACQVGNAFACRSDTESIRHLGFTTNRMLIGAIAAEVSLLLILIHVLPLRNMVGLAPLAPVHWLLLLTFGPLLLLFEECRKALRRRMAVAPLHPKPATQL